MCRACIRASGEWTAKITDALLLRARDLAGPRAEASAELIRPLVNCLKDEALARPAHQDLSAQLLFDPLMYQRGLVEAPAHRGAADGLMLGLSQHNAHHVRALKHWFSYLLEFVLEVSDIVLLPEGRQFLDGIRRRILQGRRQLER